jgi:hypothetical protein
VHIASSQAYNSQGLPNLIWEDNDSFSFNGDQYSITQIKTAIQSQLHQAEEVLYQGIFKGMPVEEMMPFCQRPKDILQQTKKGYNFLQDMDNPYLKSQHKFAKALLGDKVWGPIFAKVNPEGKLEYNTNEVNKFMQQVQVFLKHLFFLMHVTGGMPPRGTEASETLLVNTPTAQRNLYFIDKHFCLVHMYNKTSHNSGFDKVIPRAFPKQVSKLLLDYLALVCPLERVFARAVVNQVHWHLFDTHLWVGPTGKWDTRQMTTILQRAFSEHGSIDIGVAAWRHIITSIVRKCVSEKLKLRPEVKEAVMIAAADDQAGHSHDLALRLYGQEYESLQGMSDETLKKFLAVRTSEPLQVPSDRL